MDPARALFVITRAAEPEPEPEPVRFERCKRWRLRDFLTEEGGGFRRDRLGGSFVLVRAPLLLAMALDI